MLFLIPAMALDYTWSTLHASSHHPDVLKRTVANYREKFPCLDCREHFQLLLETHPFPLEWQEKKEHGQKKKQKFNK